MEGLKNYRKEKKKKKAHSLKIKLQTRTTSLGNGILFFAKPTIFANSQVWVIAAPLHSQGSLERRLFWLWFLLYKWYHLHSSSVSRAQKRELVFRSPKLKGRQWQCMRLGAMPYILWPSNRLFLCNCWPAVSLPRSEDRLQWEVTMTSGLTATSTFSTTNTLLRPDFWQEKQVPCLRFPFKDFFQPSFNSASYSITQRKEASSLPPSCYHTTFWTSALFCPIWAWRNISSGGTEAH